ncbi:MAG TPA: PIG-L deacetylase family protein [Acidimicrobiales bacterium]
MSGTGRPPDPAGVRLVSGLPTGDLLDTVTVTVDLPVPRRALAVGAHPDDIEFGAGATLAKWAAAGCAVHHLVLTDGSKGSWDPDEDLDDLVAARKLECRAAAARLDPRPSIGEDRVRFLGAVDGELANDSDTRRQVAGVIREVHPDVVLGHDPWRRYRLHPDHRAAGFLVLDAVVAARDPHFHPELALDPHRPSALLLWEADLANHVERAAGFEDTKVDALLCHHSQLETTMGVIADDGSTTAGRDAFADRIAWQLAQHGAVAGIDSGEAFHLIDQL